MIEQDKKSLLKFRLAVGLLAFTAIGLLLLFLSGHGSALLRKMYAIFQSKDTLRAYVESWGAWAPAVFITIQALQVVIAPIPGELTGAVGGFIFGAVPNIMYSTIGLTLGSTLAFLVARVMGAPIVKRFVPTEQLRKFHFLTERKGSMIALVLFTLPGFPKDFLCYILGLSPMGFFQFLAVCTIGRIPGTILLSYSGSAVFNEDWTLLLIMGVLCAVVIGALYVFRDKIDRKMSGGKKRIL